jgi:hypothetical protein
MNPDYAYDETSRRPVTFLALPLSLAMLMFGWANDAPWYFMAPVVIGSALCVAMIIYNRRSGMVLRGSELRMYAGQWVEQVVVSDIQEMHVTRWSDGAPSAALLLASRKKLSIPGYCVGSVRELEVAFAARNISTRWNA